jgi:hypothetical protein
VSVHEHVVEHRQARGPEDGLHRYLVHADGRADHTRTRVRDIGELEKTLERSVLSERAVDRGHHHIQRDRPRPLEAPPGDHQAAAACNRRDERTLAYFRPALLPVDV